MPSMVRLMYQLKSVLKIKGDYVEKQQSCFISVTLKSWSGRKLLDHTTYFICTCLLYCIKLNMHLMKLCGAC